MRRREDADTPRHFHAMRDAAAAPPFHALIAIERCRLAICAVLLMIICRRLFRRHRHFIFSLRHFALLIFSHTYLLR